MINRRNVAIALTMPLTGTAMADVVLLDIPSGDGTSIVWSSQAGAAESFFDIESQNFNFYETGYGTPGIVYAWDSVAGVNATGMVELSSIDPEAEAFSNLQFQISGYLDRLSESLVRVFADEEEIYSEAFSLDGSFDIRTIQLDVAYASHLRIELDNTSAWAWTGLDNIEISSMSVPAPGALALLGLAGIAGRRRRD